MQELSRSDPETGTDERDWTAWTLIAVKAWPGPALGALHGLPECVLAHGHRADEFRRASSRGG